MSFRKDIINAANRAVKAGDTVDSVWLSEWLAFAHTPQRIAHEHGVELEAAIDQLNWPRLVKALQRKVEADRPPSWLRKNPKTLEITPTQLTVLDQIHQHNKRRKGRRARAR